MKKVFWIFIIYIILSPIYVFESGMPQPADFILAIACFLGVLIADKKIFLLKPIKAFIRLILLIILVSALNEYYLSLLGVKGGPMFAAIFYIYNFLVFVLVFVLWEHIPKNKLYNVVGFVIILTVISQWGFHLLGFGKSYPRSQIYFNNPNQLGYYILCIFSLFTAIPSKFRRNKSIVFGMLIMCSYLILISGSRAALLGVFLLGGIIFFKEGFKFKVSSFLGVSFFTVIIFVFVSNNEIIQSKFQKVIERNENKESTLESEIIVRGYDRILFYPEYLLYGAGEGGIERFVKSKSNLEIHSGFGTILFSYGILGFMFFVMLIFKIISFKKRSNLLLLLPVFSYNLTHNGFRSTMFWILLAFVYLVSLDEKEREYEKIT